MTISPGEWESIYSAIGQASARSEITEGEVIGHHDDGVHVFVEGFGTEPVGTVSLEYGQAVYTGDTKKTISAVAKRPEIGQRVLVARPGGTTHNPRIIGIVQTGEWKQPEDIQIPEWPTGSGIIWFTDTPPSGWLICDGTAIPAQFTKLISMIGANLPDLRVRCPVGKWTGDARFDTLLELQGTADETLALTQIPPHHHQNNFVSQGAWPRHTHPMDFLTGVAQAAGATVNVPDTAGSSASMGGAGAFRGLGQHSHRVVGDTDNDEPDHGHLVWGATDDTGGSGGVTASHNNLQPYTVVNFIIKV